MNKKTWAVAALIFTLSGCVGAPVDEPADSDTGSGDIADTDSDTDTDTDTDSDSDSDSDTSSNTGWTTAAPMPTPRAGLCGAWGGDGRLYAIGGLAKGDGPFDTVVEAYDPDLNAWTTMAPLPEPRYGCSAVTGDDGLIYVVGGEYTFEAGEWSYGRSADLLAYDPATDEWTELAPMSFGRYNGAAVWVDGKIWAIGGFDSISNTSIDTVEIYDPITDTWAVAVDTLNHPRHGHAAVYTGGKVHVVGGWNRGVYAYTAFPEVKEPGTTGWTTRPSMPGPRYLLAAAPLPGGDILVVGGCCIEFNWYETETVAQIWSPTTFTWTRVADLEPGRLMLLAATGPDGAVHVVGGWLSTGSGMVYESDDHNVWR